MRTSSSTLSIVLMYSVISLIFVYMACVFADYQLLLYFAASVFVMGVMVEKAPAAFLLFYLIVIGGAFLLVPEKIYIVPYAVFFGHYAIGKYIIDRSLSRSALIVKYGYYNGCMILLYFLCPSLVMGYIPEGMPFAVFIIIMEAVFFGYDLGLKYLTEWYSGRVRASLKRSTY